MFNLIPWILFHVVTSAVVTAQPTPPPKGDSYDLYARLDPTMLMVVMVLVGAFLLVGCLSVYIRHCNESYAIAVAAAAAAASPDQRFRPNGLDKETIESFPVFVYSYVKELKIGKGALECAVCLSEFEDDETLRFIPKCCHVFHPDCIDAWLAQHVTCPLCRTRLSPPESDAKDQPIESVSDSNITELNSNNNNSINNEESSHSRTERAEEQNELVVIQVNEETRPIRKITGKFPRSHSTGHSMIQPGENIERFTLRLPEEIRKQIERRGRLKRTRSYDVVLGMEGSSKKGGDGSGSCSRGKSIIERWVVFSRTPPFVSKSSPVKSPKCGGGGDEGDGSISWRGLTSVKDKLNCLSLKIDQVEKEDSSSRPPI